MDVYYTALERELKRYEKRVRREFRLLQDGGLDGVGRVCRSRFSSLTTSGDESPPITTIIRTKEFMFVDRSKFVLEAYRNDRRFKRRLNDVLLPLIAVLTTSN